MKLSQVGNFDLISNRSTDTKTNRNGQTRKKKKKYVSCHVLHVIWCVSLATCHQRGEQQSQTLPLLTSLLCAVGWFAKIQNRRKKKLIKEFIKTLDKTLNIIRIMHKKYRQIQVSVCKLQVNNEESLPQIHFVIFVFFIIFV